VGVITLARPEQRNALTPAMLTALTSSVGQLAGVSRAIVLTGEGAVFCAGFDLTLCRDAPDGSVMRQLLIGLSASIRILRAIALPVVIAAQGGAIAGGCALLGGGDIVITNADAKLGYPVLRLGVSPAVSGPFIQAAVGGGHARARLLDTQLITGTQALEIGLAHECTPTPGEVFSSAMAIATQISGFPQTALQTTKRWLAEVEAARVGSEDEPNLALAASLQLCGGDEERRLLAAAWAPKPPSTNEGKA
jgi:enoyl-CoA hydratase/carnithine racemase